MSIPTDRLREIIADPMGISKPLYRQLECQLATELLACREELAMAIDARDGAERSSRRQFNDIRALTRERDEAREERDRLKAVLLSKHGGEPLALLSELDEARAERDALRADRDAALLILPAACGSLADAADTLRQERDAARAEAKSLRADLCEIAEGTGCNVPDRAEAKRRIIALAAEVKKLRLDLSIAEGTRDGYRDELGEHIEARDALALEGIIQTGETLDEAVLRFRAELAAVKRHRDDLMAFHDRDMKAAHDAVISGRECKVKFGGMLVRDAIPELVAQRDAAKEELAAVKRQRDELVKGADECRELEAAIDLAAEHPKPQPPEGGA